METGPNNEQDMDMEEHHLSEYQLDRLFLGELPAEQEAQLNRHLGSCLPCTKRRKLRDEGLAAFPEVDADALLGRIHAQLESDPSASAPANSNSVVRMSLKFAPLLVIAAGFLLFIGLRNDKSSTLPENAPATIRAKGSIALRVFSSGQSGGEVLSGQALSPGDVIRFVVDVPDSVLPGSNLQAMLISIEENGGARSVYYPHEGSSSTRLILDETSALSTALELDDYQGIESLHLVTCPNAFNDSDIVFSKDSSGQSLPSGLPKGCMHSRFQIEKAR